MPQSYILVGVCTLNNALFRREYCNLPKRTIQSHGLNYSRYQWARPGEYGRNQGQNGIMAFIRRIDGFATVWVSMIFKIGIEINSQYLEKSHFCALNFSTFVPAIKKLRVRVKAAAQHSSSELGSAFALHRSWQCLKVPKRHSENINFNHLTIKN